MVLIGAVATLLALRSTAEAHGRLDAMCDLKVVVPVEGPSDVEAFPNRQAFPAWCGPDPHAAPAGVRFET